MGVNSYQNNNNPLTHSSFKNNSKIISLEYFEFIKISNHEYHITNEKWARQKLLKLETLKHEIN